MPLLKPDPTFYPSPRLAMEAPPEKHAFVAALNPPGSKLNDAILVVDLDPGSRTYGQRVGQVTLPNFGDELHHFGWNACSSALARMRRIRTSSAVTWLCLGCVRRACISSTQSRIRESRR